MNRGIRGFMLLAGSVSLLSSQAVYAAPLATGFSAIDPLVSLSVLGSPESNAAVCGAAASATAGAADAAAAAATTENSQGPAGCVLPVTGAPAAVAPVGAAPVAGAAVGAGLGIGMFPLLAGLAALIGVAALAASGGGKGKGDLTPVSPA